MSSTPHKPTSSYHVLTDRARARPSMAMARPHTIVVPYPGAGNINPALQLAKLLHHHGVYITFVNTEDNHRRVQATEGAGAVRGRDGFRFEAIPDGLSDADRGKQDYGQSLLASTTTRCAAPLRDLIVRLNATPGVPPVTCVLPTGLMAFALDVARDLGIPSMVFWCGGAASLMANLRMRELKERGYVPLKGKLAPTRILFFFLCSPITIFTARTDESFLTNGYLDTTVIDWIPGVPPITLGDISSFVRTTDPNDFGLAFCETEIRKCTKAGALILNTFDSLDADVLAALRSEFTRVYTVGPLGTLLRQSAADTDRDSSNAAESSGLSLWKQDAECLDWLDTQAHRSVVYVNFGSHTVVTPEQLAEFAWGLASSGHPFLWSIRDDDVRGGGLSAAFMADTAGRCRVTAWCPQERVLRHPAVGCFLTHCGWNSTCESVAAGVPMVCWPGFADQYANCKYACEVWGVGVRLDAEVRREQVASRVGEAMGSEEIKTSAARWKEAALAACCPGGSSPHVVVLPYPEAGNINPALQMAKLLHRHGAYVTFVNTEHNHRRVQATEGAGAVRGREGFRFEAIPDGLSSEVADRAAQDSTIVLCVSITTRGAAPFRALLARLAADPGVPPVTCVLTTLLMSFALDVAREQGIPTMAFWTCSAASFLADMRLPELEDRGYVPLKNEGYLTNGHLDTTVIDWIPGMPPIRLGDFSSFVRTTDPDDFCLRLIASEANNCKKADALVINTFDGLEADVLAALRADNSTGLSLWKQDAECLAWLDAQQPRSVVYVSFGSIAVVTPEQLAEFAWGLAASGHRFLWCIRDGLRRQTAGRCRVTAWCPQEQVLRHPAVGCFLTHSGWNSTCESMAAGVPMVCWPGFADQYTRYVCEAWGIGVRLDAEVKREQVAERVRAAMASEEMRRDAAKWKAEAEAAAGPGGSSYQNLLAMVRALGSSSNSSQEA
ncbi:hypothetical protein U9M48_024814 [Paspalum notatum var. saurae]|uniref:Uncharacterized protein n=1 Tax=Paspalum notatum var. saurae TaxID=547442 RepID=A0AAQ3TP30_PASNO